MLYFKYSDHYEKDRSGLVPSTMTEGFKAAVLNLFESKGFDRSDVIFEPPVEVPCGNRMYERKYLCPTLRVKLDPFPSSDRGGVPGGTKRKACGSICN